MPNPLFILYTSGSTGKQKEFATGGYIVYASMTHQYIFDYKPKDIYWCTAVWLGYWTQLYNLRSTL